MITVTQFMKDTLGKGYDIDGCFGTQCWDYFAHFCKCMKYPVINCNPSGYVKSIYENRKNNGVLKNFKEISLDHIKKGDWIVWGDCATAPKSHIAMYVGEKNGSLILVYGQNQDTKNMKVTARWLSTAGIIGVLRAKDWESKTPHHTLHKIKPKTVTTKYDINVRDIPSVKGKIMANYEPKMKVTLDSYTFNEGILWGSYVSHSNKRRYIAIGELKPYVE